MNEDSIPTGEIRSVENTPFATEYRKMIGRDVSSPDEQLIIGRGYDHNFCLENYTGALREFAMVYDPESGRKNDVLYRPSRSPVLHRQLYGRLANR